jgi:hypothetical protein
MSALTLVSKVVDEFEIGPDRAKVQGGLHDDGYP